MLEIVQIEEQQRKMFAAPLGRSDRLSDAVVQQRAVGQIGQKIMLGQMGHFGDHRLGRGDVVEDHDRPGQPSVES